MTSKSPSAPSRQGPRRTAFLAALALWTGIVPVQADEGVLGGVLPGVVPMSQTQLQDVRGGYAGFYFTVDYAGNVINTELNPVQGTDPVSTGGQTTINADSGNVQISAQVGTLKDTSGVIQIVQVPGSNNIVNAVMNVNMTVINVASDAAAANVAQTLSNLYGVP